MNIHSSNFDRVVLTVPGKAEYLDLIRRVVTDVVQRMGFDEEDAAKIEMAVDEACTNVIDHSLAEGAAPDAPEKIDLTLSIEVDRIVITITDAGQPFSPVDFEPIDLQTYFASGEGHGLGIYIMKTFMDEVVHSEPPDGGNQLTLVKYLPSTKPKASPPQGRALA